MLIPIWAFITLQSIAGLLVLVAITLLARAWLRRKDLQTRRCYRCHYDLSATSGLRCPECGREAKSEAEHLGKSRRWRSTRRAAIPLAAAALVCFAGFFVAWPVWMLPDWLFVRTVPWLVTCGHRSRELVTEELMYHRRLNSHDYVSLLKNTVDALRTDPIDPGVDGLLTDLTPMQYHRLTDSTAFFMNEFNAKHELALESLLTDEEAILVMDTLMDADRRSFRRELRTEMVGYRLLGQHGEQISRWVADRYFAPNSDWAWLNGIAFAVAYSDDHFLRMVIQKFDYGNEIDKLRAAHFIRRYSRAKTLPPTDEYTSQRWKQIVNDSTRLDSRCDELLNTYWKQLSATSISSQLEACSIAYLCAYEPGTQNIINLLVQLYNTSPNAQVRRVAKMAISKITRTER